MPELPEVETTIRGLRSRVRGHIITDFWCDHGNIIRYISVSQLRKLVRGKKIIGIRRRAKHILIDLSGGKSLVIHMKMTGHLLYGKWKMLNGKWKVTEKGPLRDDPYNRFIHAIFTLVTTSLKLRGAKTHLAFSDMRKFGKIAIHDTNNLGEAKELENLGPELWEITAKKFADIYLNVKSGKPTSLKLREPRIKQKLLDQHILAGVGNIYSDEGLWASGIHPLSQPNKIPETKLKKLFKALVAVTKASLKTGGDSMSDYRNIDGVGGEFQNFHKAYRHTDKRCKKRGCTGIINRIVVGTRSTHFCPKHQTLYGS